MINKTHMKYLLIPALIVLSSYSLADNSSFASYGTSVSNGLGGYIITHIVGIYRAIDLITTLFVGVTMLFMIMGLTDPRDRQIGGFIFAFFLLAALLPNNEFLMKLLIETIFDQTTSVNLEPETIKSYTFNKNEEVNNLLVVLLLVIQLIGKIFLIWQTFTLANILRGKERGSAARCVIGIIAAAILYNMYDFLMALKGTGGILQALIERMFNTGITP